MNKKLLLLLLVPISAHAAQARAGQRLRRNQRPACSLNLVADAFKKQYAEIAHDRLLDEEQKRTKQIACLHELLNVLNESTEQADFATCSAKLNRKLRQKYEQEIQTTQQDSSLTQEQRLQQTRGLLSSIYDTYQGHSDQQAIAIARIQEVERQLTEVNIVTMQADTTISCVDRAEGIVSLLTKLAGYFAPSHADATPIQQRLTVAMQAVKTAKHEATIARLKGTVQELLKQGDKPYAQLYETYIELCDQYVQETPKFKKWKSRANQLVIEDAEIQAAAISEQLQQTTTYSVESLLELHRLRTILLEYYQSENMPTEKLTQELQVTTNRLNRARIGGEINALDVDKTIKPVDKLLQLSQLYSQLSSLYPTDSNASKIYSNKATAAHKNAEIAWAHEIAANPKAASADELIESMKILASCPDEDDSQSPNLNAIAIAIAKPAATTGSLQSIE